MSDLKMRVVGMEWMWLFEQVLKIYLIAFSFGVVVIVLGSTELHAKSFILGVVFAYFCQEWIPLVKPGGDGE